MLALKMVPLGLVDFSRGKPVLEADGETTGSSLNNCTFAEVETGKVDRWIHDNANLGRASEGSRFIFIKRTLMIIISCQV